MTTRRISQIPSVPHDLPEDLRRVLLALKERSEIERGERPNQSAMDRVVTQSRLTSDGDLWTRIAGADARLALGADGAVLGGLGGALGYVGRWVRLAPTNVAGIREVDFTGIPSWATTLMFGFRSVLKGGTTDTPFLRLGDAGGFETSGYLGAAMSHAPTIGLHSGSFSLTVSFNGNNTYHGGVVLNRLNAAGTHWQANWLLGLSNTSGFALGAGTKILSEQLDRVRIALTGTTDNFTSGEITMRYS